MDIAKRLAALRCEMRRTQTDICIVPSSDFHQSEYVGGYFKAREFITGFTGSAGTAVVTKDRAGLWTDGRYFIQAEQELDPGMVTLFRSGQPGVDTIREFLKKELPQGGVIGFDGRTVGVNEGKLYAGIAEERDGKIEYRRDLIGKIWKDRPCLPDGKFFPWEQSIRVRASPRNWNGCAQVCGKKEPLSICFPVWTILPGC